MSQQVAYEDVVVGSELPPLQVRVQRLNLIMYAGASGDFNVIHWNERVARAVGLPDVIAHGMFTMAQAARVLTAWTGDPGSVVELGVRFSRPVVVPDDDQGTLIDISGVVEEKLGGNRVKVALTARVGEAQVLSGATAVLALS
ncbi:MAG: MaoC/PaaZ C-terminal domain-containing protein [Mycobacteriales bacterium]